MFEDAKSGCWAIRDSELGSTSGAGPGTGSAAQIDSPASLVETGMTGAPDVMQQRDGDPADDWSGQHLCAGGEAKSAAQRPAALRSRIAVSSTANPAVDLVLIRGLAAAYARQAPTKNPHITNGLACRTDARVW